MKLIVIFITILILSGCDLKGKYESVKEEVEAIYWHEKNRYSVATVDGNELSIKVMPTCGVTPKIIMDVKLGDKSWYFCERYYSKFNGYNNPYCEIHLEGVDSIRTADWNHEKFGSGETARIR